MATSGSFNTTGYEGRYLTFTWSLESQSSDTNSSVISWTLKGAGDAQSSWYRSGNFKVVINGTVVYSSSARIELYEGTLVASGSITINHDSDGEKTFTASAEAGIYTTAVNCSGSGSWSLPQIPRYALISSAPNFTDEDNPTITFSNPTNANLTLKIEAGGNTSLIVRSVIQAQSPYTFVLTESERESLRELIPNSNNLGVRFSIGTRVGDITRWSVLDRTMTIVNANPIITGANYADVNSVTKAITGNDQEIIQTMSRAQFEFTELEAIKSATLSKIEITINALTVEDDTLTGSSVTDKIVYYGGINSSSDVTAVIKLTDSRGNTSTTSVLIDMLSWNLPTAIITCARKNNYYAETDLTVNASYSSLGGDNTITIQYQTKEVDSSTWGALQTIQDNETVTINLDNTKAWNIKVIVTDRLGSTTYNLTVDKGIPIVFFDRLKKSVGFNCFPSNDDSVESQGLVLDDKICIGSQTLLDNVQSTTAETRVVLTAYDYKLIEGLFEGITIPSGYTRGYRISAQINTNNGNTGAVKLNNIESNTGYTWSSTNMRHLISTPIFKESDITLETCSGYTRDGLNLYIVNSDNYIANFYNITVHGYLIKGS